MRRCAHGSSSAGSPRRGSAPETCPRSPARPLTALDGKLPRLCRRRESPHRGSFWAGSRDSRSLSLEEGLTERR